ncbi:MAG: GAF domain-containing SpoIIE family protein phosphatase, partial [Bacteroidota bacterium]
VNRLLMERTTLLTTLLGPLFYTLGIFALTIFFLSAVFIYKRFILYQKTRRKISSWNAFWIVLALALLSGMSPSLFQIPSWGTTTFFVFSFALFLYLSSNVSWTAYLNFQQKLRALGLFVLLIIVSSTYLTALGKLPDELQLTERARLFFDVHLSLNVVYFIAIFTLTYSGFSILVLFFNLPTASIFEKRSSEIASFNRINQAIQSNLDFSDILNALLEASILSSNAHSGWIEIFDEDNNSKVELRKGIVEEEIARLAEAYDIPRHIKREGQYLLVKNLKKHRTFRAANSRYKSLLAVPITSPDKVHGLVYIVKEISNSFEDVTVNSLVNYGEQAGAAITNARRIKDAIELERYREELKIAKHIQGQLLPQKLPVSDRIEFVALNEAADEVGGDYFDILDQGNGRFRVAIGDVSGKGTTAAFYMAEVKGMFHALSLTDLEPDEFICHANQALYECFERGFFMTLTYLDIDLEKQEMEMVRAGHCPALYYQADADRVQSLRKGTLGLGIVPKGKYARKPIPIERLKLVKGDFLVLFTDGLIEARNPEGEEFGQHRLEALVNANRQQTSSALAKLLIDEAQKFSHQTLDDDYTLLVIRIL